MYGDTEVIRQLAVRMRVQGDEVRREARRLRTLAEDVPWEGVAAEAMRLRARWQHQSMLHRADLHDEAARSLDRHADEVDRLKALIAAIERKVRALVSAARDRLASLAGSVADLVGAADPADLLLDRFVPPPSGHKDWLSVDLPGVGL